MEGVVGIKTTRRKTNYSVIPLISSGFTDKLCKAPDVYQRIHTTLMARVGGTGGERERWREGEDKRGSDGGRRGKDGCTETHGS